MSGGNIQFVDLERTFTPVSKKEQLDWGSSALGRKYGGWLNWPDLLEKPYTIILAEAGGGKTEELRFQSQQIVDSGAIAFYMTVQSVAERGVERSLPPLEVERFRRWLGSDKVATFFVDSVDEAKLRFTDIEQCLNGIAHELLGALSRCRFVYSCRGSDWDWERDVWMFKQFLSQIPALKKVDKEDPLIGPVLREQEENFDDQKSRPSNYSFEIFRINDLDTSQQLALAQSAGINDEDSFFKEIQKNKLDRFVDRPKDLLDLVFYWNENGALGSRREVIEAVISNKLREIRPGRPDQDKLSEERAREGAEIIAAAMVFGKTTSLLFTDDDLTEQDEENSPLNPKRLLPDWTEAEISSLLRRAVFAPSTFGRSRFHHRETQEYLAACWVHRLLERGWARETIKQLFFVDLYGSTTLIPSRRPTVAWLANIDKSWIKPILDVEPLVLLQHGDPGSLPLADKMALLQLYADKHSRSLIGDDGISNESLWMFADPALTTTIQNVWNLCEQIDFRLDLIRLIAEGEIHGCKDLIVSLLQCPEQSEGVKCWALETAEILGAESERATFAESFLKDVTVVSNASAVSYSRSLFPKHLTVGELFEIIQNASAPERHTVGGFGYELKNLWNKCPLRDRSKFAAKLSELCLQPPYQAGHYRVSRKYRYLCKYVDHIALGLLEDWLDGEQTELLVELLMVMERRERSATDFEDADKERFFKLLDQNWQVRRALLWKDVEECRAEDERREVIDRYWQVTFIGQGLHRLKEADRDWLLEDTKGKSLSDDRQIALSAWIRTFDAKDDGIKDDLISCRSSLDFDPNLTSLIDAVLTPRAPFAEEKARQERQEKRAKEHQQEEKKRKQNVAESWRKFKKYLLNDSTDLMDPNVRYNKLHWLIVWLSKANNSEDIYDSSALSSAFSKEIRDRFDVALSAHWKATKARRPKRNHNGHTTYKWIHKHAAWAVRFEFENSNAELLKANNNDLRNAVRHLLFDEQVEVALVLARHRPEICIPLIKSELNREWQGKNGHSTHILYHLGRPVSVVPNDLLKHLLNLFMRQEPYDADRFERAATVLINAPSMVRNSSALLGKLLKMFEALVPDEPSATSILACIFACDFGAGSNALQNKVKRYRREKRKDYVETLIGGLFGRNHNGIATKALSGGSPRQLYDLAVFAFKSIRLKEDVVHEGSYTPGRRDNAEDGRGTILQALRDKRSVEAHTLAVRFATKFPKHSHWMRQNARKMLDRDSEQQAWSEMEFNRFRTRQAQPIKYGSDLFKAVLNTISDVRTDWLEADGSPRPVIMKYMGNDRSRDEESLQLLSLEALTLRSKQQFLVSREPIVADKKEPDLLASAPPYEVAIEIKQADHLTYAQLSEALHVQLVGQYLRPSNRKHGVLLLINTRDRKWSVPNQKALVRFDLLLDQLNKVADKINRGGTIELVIVVGIDLT